ncbi:MAG: DUF488 domain-containing protein [Pseudomonadota bacterium]|nr:DUF488 domain-containing protein [Pseudomonadota bacterium]
MIYTIGHSTYSIGQFLEILRSFSIEALADIRTIPRSRHNPQFNEEALRRSLQDQNIKYVWMKALGGLRHPRKDSPNEGWRNLSFRGYADYMQTAGFHSALPELIELAKVKRTVIMCAEAVPWRCHRSLVADALSVRRIPVEHIMSAHKSSPHRLTEFAVVRGESITYPSGGTLGLL